MACAARTLLAREQLRLLGAQLLLFGAQLRLLGAQLRLLGAQLRLLGAQGVLAPSVACQNSSLHLRLHPRYARLYSHDLGLHSRDRSAQLRQRCLRHGCTPPQLALGLEGLRRPRRRARADRRRAACGDQRVARRAVARRRARGLPPRWARARAQAALFRKHCARARRATTARRRAGAGPPGGGATRTRARWGQVRGGLGALWGPLVCEDWWDAHWLEVESRRPPRDRAKERRDRALKKRSCVYSRTTEVTEV